MALDKSIHIKSQLALAHLAAAGDEGARKKVNAIAEPMINYQTPRFCKRFCKENQFHYQCSLIKPLYGASKDASLCEWGNASYGWMLNDLSNEKRLLKYEARHGASIFDYLYQIANSLPFYERWKDWRFSRRIHVPDYIKQLSPYAANVFLALRSADNIKTIAHNLVISMKICESLCRDIVVELTKRKRLYLLNPPSLASLSQNSDEGEQQDIADYDEDPALQEQKMMLSTAWLSLTATEQFVLEAMLIDEEDAEDVLIALNNLDISIKKGVSSEQTNIQQLYYFRRKTINKLAEKIL